MTASTDDPQIRGVFGQPFDEQAAFFRNKLGRLIPTATWRDVEKHGHDIGFMVAGAAKADLLADFAAAVDRGVVQGGTLEEFRQDFDNIVERHGWDYTGERNWRTRVIYTTNMRTSYAAGRLAQLRAGNFKFWMYKHGGSAEPRAQHLAWDGLVLPTDHPFWETHFPPNGWGCSCRVVGVRSPEGATRLGGDPNKRLPSDWDKPDPKTGAPRGIGTGWDYQPGGSVSDTVQQMASKTQQWDYTLAKSYMESLPDSVGGQIGSAYRRLPSVADEVRRFAQRELQGNTIEQRAKLLTLGRLSQRHVDQVGQKTGETVNGYDFSLGRSEVLKIRKDHGTAAREALRGQRAVTAKDYSLLPQILEDGAITEAGRSRVGRKVVRIAAQIDGEVHTVALEVRGRRRSLGVQSWWIRPAASR